MRRKRQKNISRSGLKDKQAEEYLEKLMSYVETNKPYLDR